MITKEKKANVKVPILKIKVMDDETWNRLAYKNLLQRKGLAL